MHSKPKIALKLKNALDKLELIRSNGSMMEQWYSHTTMPIQCIVSPLINIGIRL
jgi:hypothetical protein